MLRSKITLPILLLANFVLRLLVAVRPLKFIDGLCIPDDAYLSLTIARNIARGLGPLYGLEHTNGFQPMYSFLMAPVYWLFPNDPSTPVHFALVVLAIFDTATLYLLYRFLSKQSRSPITPFIIALAWVLNPYVIYTVSNGMETSISLFFIMAAYYFYHGMLGRNPAPGPKNYFLSGVFFGLAMLARIDNILLLFSAIMIALYNVLKNRKPIGAAVSGVCFMAAGTLLVYSPWMIYSYHYTGDLYQVSGRALRFMSLANVDHQPTFGNWYAMVMKAAYSTIIARNRVLIALIAVSVAALIIFRGWRSLRGLLAAAGKYNLILIFSVLLCSAYVSYIFGTWYFSRYFYPVMLLFTLYLAVVVDEYNVFFQGRQLRPVLNCAVIAIILATSLFRPSFGRLYFSTETESFGYMNLGLWARDYFPDGTIVGSSQTGALGYFADNLTVVNLDGVVNKPCFEALRRKENMTYIRQVGVQYVIGWKINIDFIRRETRGFNPDDLEFVMQVPGFRSWNENWLLYRVR